MFVERSFCLEMANFNVHIGVATSCTTVVATLGVSFHFIDLQHMPWLIFLGIVGGMLPDIDAVNSRPVRLLFTILSLLSATAVLSAAKQYYGQSPQLLLLGGGVYWFTRYLVLASIKRLTVHRGIFHSILALCFFSFAMTCISFYSLKQNTIYAWLNGFFIGFGFFVHLVLDEMYSVDLANRRIKKSFGTALKLFNYKNVHSSVLMAIFTGLLYWFSPPALPLFALSERIFSALIF